MKVIRHHWQLDVYRLSVEAAMQIFELTKAFPREEMYSLTDQIRRSSRSVSGQTAEGWRKRKYEASFVSKLNDAEGEAAETQSWLEYSVKCGYMERSAGRELHRAYDRILGKLVNMAMILVPGFCKRPTRSMNSHSPTFPLSHLPCS